MSIMQYFDLDSAPLPLAWNPSWLFPEAWPDPSDLPTMFQNQYAEGLVGAGSPIGTMLDKSNGLGLENKANSGSIGPNTTYDPVTGNATFVRLEGDTSPYVQWRPVKAVFYLMDIEHLSGDPIQVRRGTLASYTVSTLSSGERKTFVIFSAGGYITIGMSASPATSSFVVHSMREIPGNHATQATVAARPMLIRMPATGRRNLLTYTEDASGWITPGTEYGGNPIQRKLSGVAGSTNSSSQIVALYPLGATGSGYFGRQIEFKPLGDTRYLALGGSDNSRSEWYDCTTEEFLFPQKSTTSYRTVIKTDDGWLRYTSIYFAETAGSRSHSIRWGDTVPTSQSSLQGAYNLSGSNIAIRKPMLQPFDGPAEGPLIYQRVANTFDVTEAGVPDVWSLRFDGDDDALTTVLSQAINGDILIAGTNGTIIAPVSYAAGSTFSIGPTTYTGGTPGVLAAVGDIVGVVLVDRALSELERTLLIDYYKEKGAKGLLVAGSELVVNGDFSEFDTTEEMFAAGWINARTGAGKTTLENGRLVCLNVGAGLNTGGACYPLSAVAGRFYEINFSLVVAAGGSAKRVAVANVISRPDVGTLLNSTHTATGNFTRLYQATETRMVYLHFFNQDGDGVRGEWDSVSVRELRAQED